MKILMLSSSFLPQIGGAEIAVHNLSESLTSFGHDVLVCTATSQKRNFSKRYQLSGFFQPRGATRLRVEDLFISIQLLKVANDWKPDIIHSHLFYPNGLAGARVGNLLNIPTVVTSHGGDILVRPEINYGFRLDNSLNRKINTVAKMADGFIAISDVIFKKYLAIGIDQNKTAIIPNGIQYNFINGYVKRKSTNKHENLNVLLVGRNHPVKAYPIIIPIIPQVLKVLPNVTFWFIGEGVDKLSALAEKYSLFPPQVNFINRASPIGVDFQDNLLENKNSILDYYSIADLFLMPSYSEGLPVSLLEAMASGLPIVASFAAGSDLVVNNENGILFAEGDTTKIMESLLYLLTHHDIRKKFGENSKIKASRYDFSVISKQHIDFYLKIKESL